MMEVGVEIQGYDAAQMVKAAKRAGLSALAALPVEMFARKRAFDDLQARRRQAPDTVKIPAITAPGTVAGRAGTPPPKAHPEPALPAPRAFGPRGLPVQHTPGRYPAGRPREELREPVRSADRPAARTRPEFLVEPEPAGTFGSDELTAPPVIGRD